MELDGSYGEKYHLGRLLKWGNRCIRGRDHDIQSSCGNNSLVFVNILER